MTHTKYNYEQHNDEKNPLFYSHSIHWVFLNPCIFCFPCKLNLDVPLLKKCRAVCKFSSACTQFAFHCENFPFLEIKCPFYPLFFNCWNTTHLSLPKNLCPFMTSVKENRILQLKSKGGKGRVLELKKENTRIIHYIRYCKF